MAKSNQAERQTAEKDRTGGVSEIEETIKTRDASDRFQISKPFLYQLMARREIAYVQLGRHRRIVVSSLQAYLKKHLVPAIESAG
jgi:excisionase family DNA binding protein